MRLTVNQATALHIGIAALTGTHHVGFFPNPEPVDDSAAIADRLRAAKELLAMVEDAGEIAPEFAHRLRVEVFPAMERRAGEIGGGR